MLKQKKKMVMIMVIMTMKQKMLLLLLLLLLLLSLLLLLLLLLMMMMMMMMMMKKQVMMMITTTTMKQKQKKTCSRCPMDPTGGYRQSRLSLTSGNRHGRDPASVAPATPLGRGARLWWLGAPQPARYRLAAHLAHKHEHTAQSLTRLAW